MKKHSECSIQIIVSESNVWNAQHLVNCRWHDIDSVTSFSRSYDNQIQLYNDTEQFLKHGKFEAIRHNSNGTTQVNKNFIDFISHPSNLPRKACGCKFLQKDKNWVIFYVNTHGEQNDDGSRKAIRFPKYTQPQPGGSFSMPPYMLSKYPFLFDFMSCKIYTALILNELNKLPGYNIQPTAVYNQLKQLEKAREIYSNSENDIISFLSEQSKYTKVTHPVSYHTDTFQFDKEKKQSMAGLENKVCFINPLIPNIGRGGCGEKSFVYALLDW